MILFHVSFEEFEVGQTYVASNPICYHIRARERNECWINEILDRFRPDGYPSRISSFYACDSITNCQAFIGPKKIDGKNPIYYKVEMDCDNGFPMVLTDQLRRLGNNCTHLGNCINEYWSPAQDWKYLEYLSPNMRILEVIPTPNSTNIFRGKTNYQHDFDIAIRLYS